MANNAPPTGSKTPADQGAVRDRFSHRTYVADFGSYEGNRRTEEPDNELLVGREAQRARLLNLLLNTAQRGAYLVTGHRGSGKTTFVNYCLNEYRFEIFYRYLKSNLGRAFLWDRFGLVIFGVLLFLFGMLVHQSLAYLFLLPSRGILHWLAIAFLSLIACYPFVAAYERLKLISERLVEIADLRASKLKKQLDDELEVRRQKKAAKKAGQPFKSDLAASKRLFIWLNLRIKSFLQAISDSDRPNMRPFLGLVVIACLSWFWVRAGHPAESMAELVYAAGWLFLLVTLAHPTFPRAQELHIPGLLVVIAGDFWITNSYLETHFPHNTVGFFICGLFSGSLGLLLAAYQKHEGVQNWFRIARKHGYLGQVPLFIRRSPLNRIWPPWVEATSQPPVSRASLMVIYLTFLGPALTLSYLFFPKVWHLIQGPYLWLKILLLVFLPVLIDLFYLCVPTALPLKIRNRRNTELTQTAEAAIASARWYVLTGVATLGTVWIYLTWFDQRIELLNLAAIKALILLICCHLLYVALRAVRAFGCKIGVFEEKTEPDGSSPTWRTHSRYRTRADAKDFRQELLQAAISGQHAQPLLLIFGKAIILVQLGLILVYPTLASIQNSDLFAEPESSQSRQATPTDSDSQCSSQSFCIWLERFSAVPHDAEEHIVDAGSLFRRAESSTIDLFANLKNSKDQGESTIPGLRGTIEWILALLFLTLAIAYLEYEWILRGGQHVRPDRTLRHQTSEVRLAAGVATGKGEDVSRSYQRRLLEQTLFWRVHQSWLPILTVPVNLGFDSLDHRRVVEAMLTGLRDAYHKLFFQWSSPTRLLLRGGGFIALLWLSSVLGNRWFHIDDTDRKFLKAGLFCMETAPPNGPLSKETSPGMQLACLGGEITARMTQWPLLRPERPSARTGPLAEDFKTHYSGTVFGVFFPEVSDTGEISIRVYHLLIFLALLGSTNWIIRRRPILPYRRTLNEIELLLSQISSHQREELRYHPALIPRLVGVFTGEDKVKHWESEPFDPRTIEISVLRILRDIQDPTVHFPYLAKHRINLPTPEIIFKFDELDKLGIGVLPQHETTGPEVGENEQFDLERQRTRALHSLFADMKNLVSSGAARFIFIGGRNLHDEWLADQTARRPLLTNIFEVEIYLPSLLLGEGPVDSNAKNLTDGVMTFVEAQYQHAIVRNRRALLHRYRPWLTPWLETPAEPIFVQATRKKLGDSHLPNVIVRGVPLAEGHPPKKATDKEQPRRWGNRSLPVWKDALINDFMEFLAYRSRGNVKRLKATLERFVEPSLKVLGNDLPVDCQHVLVFRDTDRFRIQLIAEIYRRILSAFDPRIRFYDDKLVVGLLYIADFLLKFHRRAFAWNSLQKVDELVHIHRAPELPNAISDLLHAWQQKYLHRIRNGMYDYRFNSDFAMELQYLSRRSDEELAALNFTLDESQALKALYRSRLSQLKDPSSYEFVAVLGELHEFDGEYDVARYYYNRALSYLDEHFHMQVARKKDLPAFFSVMLQGKDGLEAVRRRIAWGIARLRLKMQIGMSYEQSNDLEQAQGHYRNARSLASAIMRALLNAKVLEDEEGPQKWQLPRAPDYGHPDYASTLKHLNLLFQPAFAEAWVSEKHTGGVDTSARLIERSIWELRWRLPLVREEFDPNNVLRLFHGWVPDHDVLHLNFALIMAEQHNKVGDLLFFKGGVSFDPPANRSAALRRKLGYPAPPNRLAGYLTRSRYHYAMTLHELRFFNRSRRLRWAENHGGAEDLDPNPLAHNEWGDFVFRATGGSLADFGETFLATTSAIKILCRPQKDSFSRLSSSQKSLEQRISSKRHYLDLSESVIRHWLSGIGRMPSGVAEATTEWMEPVKASKPRSPLHRHLYGQHNQRFTQSRATEPTPWTLSSESWRSLVLKAVLGQKLNAPRRAEGASKDSPTNPVSWALPFDRALGPWFGVAADRKELHQKLRPEWRSGKEHHIRAEVQEFLEAVDSQPVQAEQHSTLKDLADGKVRNLIEFAAVDEPLESLSAYIVMGWTSARIRELGGFYEDSARKKLRLLETIVHYLSWAGMIRRLQGWAKQDKIKVTLRSNDDQLVEKLKSWKHNLDDRCPEASEMIIDELFDLGWLLLQDAESLYRRGRTEWDSKDSNEVGTRLPTQMLILGSSLGLAWVGLKGEISIEDSQGEPTLLGALEQRIHSWVQNESPPCVRADSGEHQTWLRTQIIEILERNAYPLMGRLNGLKALVDDTTLTPLPNKKTHPQERERVLWESCQHLSELIQLEDLYDGKWHFTPFQIGSTLALFTLQTDDVLKEIDDLVKRQKKSDINKGRRHSRMLPETRELREMARRHLIEGHEMYTMRRSYYRSISRLFYLHDDFNDRRIHYNHAVQMTAAEISQTFLAFLDLAIEEDDRKRMD